MIDSDAERLGRTLSWRAPDDRTEQYLTYLSPTVALAVTKALSRLASLDNLSKSRGQLSWSGRGGSPSSDLEAHVQRSY